MANTTFKKKDDAEIRVDLLNSNPSIVAIDVANGVVSIESSEALTQEEQDAVLAYLSGSQSWKVA